MEKLGKLPSNLSPGSRPARPRKPTRLARAPWWVKMPSQCMCKDRPIRTKSSRNTTNLRNQANLLSNHQCQYDLKHCKLPNLLLNSTEMTRSISITLKRWWPTCTKVTQTMWRRVDGAKLWLARCARRALARFAMRWTMCARTFQSVLSPAQPAVKLTHSRAIGTVTWKMEFALAANNE